MAKAKLIDSFLCTEILTLTQPVNIDRRQGIAGQSQWRGLSEKIVFPCSRVRSARKKQFSLPPADKASAWRRSILTPQGIHSYVHRLGWRERGIGWMLMIFLIIFTGTTIQAETIDHYPLTSNEKQQQFQGLISQLRCLVCQNQDLADSNADLAKDLRLQVYNMVKDGKSDTEIKQYMVSRYGDFILFKPPLNGQTYILWTLPFLLLVIGFLILWRIVNRRKKIYGKG